MYQTSSFASISDHLERQDFFLTSGAGESAEQAQMRDIPLFLQNQKRTHFETAESVSDIWISRLGQPPVDSSQRLGQRLPGVDPNDLEHWKMNLMVVSEKYRLLVVAVLAQLHVFALDPASGGILGEGPLKVVDLRNEGSEVNNMRLVTCAGREFLVTVDFAANVRMLYLDDLERDPIKFKNEYPWAEDNSTWSVDGNSVPGELPPRVVVGSNAHSLTVFNLESGSAKKLPRAHGHNVPCVSFSPCGRFIASTSIDRSVKLWEQTADGNWQAVRMGLPDKDWGWAVQWVDKNACQLAIAQPSKALRRTATDSAFGL